MKVAPVVAAFTLLITACSLLLDRSTAQCASTAECDALGSGLQCVEGSCSRATFDAGGTDAPGEGGAPCTSNRECIDRAIGEPALCSKSSHRCVELKLGSACSYVLNEESLKDDNTVVVGAFLPLDTTAVLTHPIALAYQLALNEIRNASGLPGGAGTSGRRELAMLLCDSDPSRVEDGVKHLVTTVGAPALVALFSQTDMAKFVDRYMVPSGVFTLNPQDTTEVLKGANVDRLVWHLLGTPNDVAKAYRPMSIRTEAYARKHLGNTTRRLRAAVVTSKSRTEEAIEAVVLDDDAGIVLNGESASVNEGKGDLVRISVPSLDDGPASFGDAVAQLVTARPDVVYMLAGEETHSLVAGLDAARAADGGASALPIYVLSVRNGGNGGLLAYLGSAANEPSSTKRKRFLGIQYAGSIESKPKADFLRRMNGAYPQVPQASYAATENFYDAVYWLAYGLLAAGPGAPATGDSFKTGVRKLLSGPRIYPGTLQAISDAFVAISTSATGVTYVGAMGPPDIDPATGVWNSVGAVYCYPPAAETAAPMYDVLRYNPTTQALDGDFDCFIGF